MSKELSPSFQFYAADYLADENVALMTMEDEGCYCRLMAYCWREGSIPDDPEKLAALCKGVTPSRVVVACFDFPSPEHGRLLHPRLEVERQKQAEWRAKSAKGGHKSAHKRKHSHGLTNEQGGSTTAPRVVQPNANSSVCSLQSAFASANTPQPPQGANGEELAALFELFWSHYPRKESKQEARKVFVRLKPTRQLVESWFPWLAEALQSEQWQDKNTIPHARTWLNQRRWQDDPPPRPRADALKEEGLYDRIIREHRNGEPSS